MVWAVCDVLVLEDDPLLATPPCVWLDATYVKVRRDHHIVSVAAIVAVGVNIDGTREVLGMTVGHSEAELFWTEFLRTLTRCGLLGPQSTDKGQPPSRFRLIKTSGEAIDGKRR